MRIYRGLFKFSLSSLSSFVLDYLLFSAFLFFVPRTGISVVLANVAARFISAFYNYSMNCRFVFHTHRRFRTAAHYFALAGFLLIVNNAILTTFVQSFHMSVYPAKLLTEGVLFLLSWIVQKQMIFRKEISPYNIMPTPPFVCGRRFFWPGGEEGDLRQNTGAGVPAHIPFRRGRQELHVQNNILFF